MVIGNSGSGKSTTARAIAARYGVPHVELDAIFHQAGWTPLPVDQFRGRVDDATSGSHWVVCGNYTAVRDILHQRVDAVVAIILPRHVNMWRVLRRTFLRTVRREELWNGNRETVRNVLALHDKDRSILRWAWSAYGSKRTEILAMASDPVWSARMTVVRNDEEIQRAVTGLADVMASTARAMNSTPETWRRMT
jgi:adenylate kinase family enzyme